MILWYTILMKVGIDTFGCDHGRSGIGTYLMSLVRNLPENKNNGNMDIEFELFGAEMDRFTFTGDKSFKFGWKNFYGTNKSV